MIKLMHFDNQIPFVESVFPAGEEYIKIDVKKLKTSLSLNMNLPSGFRVFLYSADSRSIMQAVLIADALKRINPNFIVELHAGYLPYGRQDRVCSEGESFSLEVFSKIIDISFDYVCSYDVHSQVTKDVFGDKFKDKYNDLKSMYLYSEFIQIFRGSYKPVYQHLFELPGFMKGKFSKNNMIVSPDKGAVDRAKQFASMSRNPVMVLDKIRDKEEVHSKIHEVLFLPAGKKKTDYKTFIVVDDICDGGATFLETARAIKDIVPDAKLHLVISHGIFSAGFDRLLAQYDSILIPNDDYNTNRIDKILN